MGRERTGCVRQRVKGGYSARVTFTDAAGKRHDVERKAETRVEAKRIARQLIKDLESAGESVIKGDRMTVSQYLREWLKTSETRLAIRTFSDYESIVDRYIVPAIGQRRLSALTPLDIQEVYTQLLKRGLSPRSVRYTHAVLSSGLRQAVKWGLLVRNSAQFVDLPKMSKKEMKALAPDQATSFLISADKTRHSLLFKLALITGMRPEEYLGLQWKDVDFSSGSLSVQRTLCRYRKTGGYYFGQPKTPRSRRSIPLPGSIIKALADHKRNQAERKLKAGGKYADLNLVFATDKGTPLCSRNLQQRYFKPILKVAGLDQSIRLYDLRHTCATLLLAANENPKVVSERLGHSSVTLTLDTYSHVLPTMQRAATDKLDAILFQL